MIRKPTNPVTAAVSQEEIKRRMAEYRREGFEHQAMPHVIYHPPNVLCPWPGCSYSIGGIDFQLEKMADPALYSQWLSAWWKGPGLVGRCPGCRNYVLFTMTDKQRVHDPVPRDLSVLPDDWHQNAYLIS